MKYSLLLLVIVIVAAEVVVAENALIAYRSTTGGGLDNPKMRTWFASGTGTWGSEFELASAGADVNWLVLKASPFIYKWVLVTLGSDGYLDAYACTSNCDLAGSWTLTSDIAFVGLGNTGVRAFDIAFETSTGDLFIVYAKEDVSPTCDLAYRLLANGDLSVTAAEVCIDDLTEAADIQDTWVAADNNPTPGSEEIVFAGFDDTNDDVSAWVWDGSTVGSQFELTPTATDTGGFEALSVKYTSDGLQGMVITGDSVIAGNVVTFYWTGAIWFDSPDFDTDAADLIDSVYWTTLKAPTLGSPFLEAVAVDSGDDLHTISWSGAAWTVTSNIDTAIDTSLTRPVDFAWNPSGGDGYAVWDTDTAGGTDLSTIFCFPDCTGATSTISSYAGAGAWLTLYQNPTSTDTVDILGIRLNSDMDIGAFYFDGATWTNYGDSAITADTGVTTFEGYSLDFQELEAPEFDLLMPKNKVNCEATVFQDNDSVVFYTCGDVASSGGMIECDVNGTNSSITYPTNATTCDIGAPNNGAFLLINNGTSNASLYATVINITIGNVTALNVTLDNYLFDAVSSPGCNGTSCNNCPAADTVGCFKDINNATSDPQTIQECDNFLSGGAVCECFSIHIDDTDLIHEIKNGAPIEFSIKKTLDNNASDPCP
jgi:hypothetical protein